MRKMKSFALGVAVALALAGFVPAAFASPVAGIVATAAAAEFFVAQNGVALSQFPSRSRLSAAVRVGTTQPVNPAGRWIASSTATWLSVTRTGKTGQQLQLTADPTGLTSDTLYTATVTLRGTPGSSVTGSIPIRVALWIGSSDPGNQVIDHGAVSMSANPVEPWVYVSDGSSTVDVFNVYSGQLLRSFRVAPSIGALQISSDGTELFALDKANYRIVGVNAKSGRILKSYRLAGPVSSDFSFTYARPAGVPTLFAPGQAAIDVATGNPVSDPITEPFSYDPFITSTADGSHLAIVERGLSPGSLYSYTVTSDNGHLTITQVNGSSIAGENCQDLAISPGGSRLYPACGWPYEFDVYDFQSLQQVQTLAANTYPNNAEFDSDNDFVGGLNGIYDPADVFVYDLQGYNLGTVPEIEVQSQGDDLVKVSGDSTRVISGMSDPSGQIFFREMPHP
ncbi:MAG TPA: hypothetical protein VJ727_05745 [Rhodanobacteraceae bacterium]|nr:hypothetical protein [Rhodanobacteraceae bacterium]